MTTNLHAPCHGLRMCCWYGLSWLSLLCVAALGAVGCSTATKPNGQAAAAHQEHADAADSPRWQLRVTGRDHLYFPLLVSPIPSREDWVAPDDLKEDFHEAYRETALGSWFTSPPLAARIVNVLGFEGNALRVTTPDDPKRVWYLPVFFVPTTLSERIDPSDPSGMTTEVTLIFPPADVIASGTLVDISSEAVCSVRVEDGQRYNAEPMLMTWSWSASTPREATLIFIRGHGHPPRNRFNELTPTQVLLKDDVQVIRDPK